MATKKKTAKAAGGKYPSNPPKGFKVSPSDRTLSLNILDGREYQVLVKARNGKRKPKPRFTTLMKCFWDGSSWIC